MSIKKVKLNYKPVAKRKCNEIAFTVSQTHMNALNQSIRQKLERNKEERIQSTIAAKEYHINSNYHENSPTKSLRKTL